ncbi:MAG: DUF4926 domain-containing protein [Acetobacteraceae bacterium]
MGRRYLANGGVVRELGAMRWGEVNEEAESRKPRFRELSRVTLTRPVETENGTLPARATGTVVHVYPQGRAYEVEFSTPLSVIATVTSDAIEA